MELVEYLVEHDGDVRISSKVVAEKFDKKHKNVIRDVRNLARELPNDFYRLNFEPKENTNLAGHVETEEIYMTRDGFSLLAMGFTGTAASKWKVRFLEAFNAMEHHVQSEIPKLRAQVARLEQERRLALPMAKKPHGNKGKIWVPVKVDTLFGAELRYKKTEPTNPAFSEISRLEGELNRLSRLAEGMNRKIRDLGDRIALKRRQ